MINSVVLVGRLARNTDIRYTSNNIAVGSFTLAVNRQYTNSNNEREADFINCVIWRKAAENLANFTSKGSLIGIKGRIQTRSYENQQGQRVYVTEVVVDTFSLLESKSNAEKRNANADQSNDKDKTNYENKNAPKSSDIDTSKSYEDVNKLKNDPFADNSKPMDISDDDLPF